MTKKVIGLFLAFVFIVVMIAGCADIKEEITVESTKETAEETAEETIEEGIVVGIKKANVETTVATTEETISQTMLETLEELIKPGQKYSEVREIIGFDGKDIGYGAILYEWKIEGGDSLLVWFVKPNTEDAVFPDDLIVQNFRMNSIE